MLEKYQHLVRLPSRSVGSKQVIRRCNAELYPLDFLHIHHLQGEIDTYNVIAKLTDYIRASPKS